MSDLLLRAQEALSAYPPWVVIGGFVVLIVLALIIAAKVFRIVGTLLLIILVIAAVSLGMHHLFSGKSLPREDTPSVETPRK